MVKQVKSTDIADIGTLQTVKLDILHPKTGVPFGLKIELQSVKSDPIRAMDRKTLDRRMQLAQRNKNFSGIDLDNLAIDRLVAATVGWEWNDITFEGSVPDLTPENVRKVYTKLVFVRDQVDEKLGDEAAFYQG